MEVTRDDLINALESNKKEQKNMERNYFLARVQFNAVIRALQEEIEKFPDDTPEEVKEFEKEILNE